VRIGVAGLGCRRGRLEQLAEDGFVVLDQRVDAAVVGLVGGARVGGQPVAACVLIEVGAGIGARIH
jgi:hypothetical protein